eukprot:gene4735-4985_t
MGVLGGSGHTNIADYRHGVLVGNWYENAEHRAQSGDGHHLLGFGAPFEGVATTAVAQHIQAGLSLLAAYQQGKTGADLAASYCRTDLTRVGKCVPAALKFHHGDPQEPPMECFATINQLTYGEKVLGEPPVQQYLWSAKTELNANEQVAAEGKAAVGKKPTGPFAAELNKGYHVMKLRK